ncbi:MAG: hypothetical protein EZS28_014769 [Streblomastix strix]|uniref:Reverse transcriptase domain-containing protein n=1 Tax=Streblomastix strix TaxID=222440 RepID=A0A5J4W519_9EUKA|nr:MAG: hypothetical protein EZS28_014769 [Streblomastix strix]
MGIQPPPATLTPVNQLNQPEINSGYKRRRSSYLDFTRSTPSVRINITSQTISWNLLSDDIIPETAGQIDFLWNRKLRKILDCKAYNSITRLNMFKMNGVEHNKQILGREDFITTLDLQDVFHLIRVSMQLLPYYGFKFVNKTYTYRGLTFKYGKNQYHFNKILTLAL